MRKQKRRYSRRNQYTFRSVIGNTYTVNLFSTMIGVLAAIYLNDWFVNLKLEKEKNAALGQVIEEITENKQLLLEWDSILTQKYEPLERLVSFMKADDKDLIMTSKEMADFNHSFPGFLLVQDSIALSDGKYQYIGELNLELNSSLALLPLESVMWESFKQSAYSTKISFSCLSSIEFIHEIQALVNQTKETWLSMLFKSGLDDKLVREDILHYWSLSIQYNRIFLNNLETVDDIMEACK